MKVRKALRRMMMRPGQRRVLRYRMERRRLAKMQRFIESHYSKMAREMRARAWNKARQSPGNIEL